MASIEKMKAWCGSRVATRVGAAVDAEEPTSPGPDKEAPRDRSGRGPDGVCHTALSGRAASAALLGAVDNSCWACRSTAPTRSCCAEPKTNA